MQHVAKKLSAETLMALHDGSLAGQIDYCLAEVMKDLDERPAKKNARKLTVELSISPIADGDRLDEIELTFSVKHSIPPFASRKTETLKARIQAGQPVAVIPVPEEAAS